MNGEDTKSDGKGGQPSGQESDPDVKTSQLATDVELARILQKEVNDPERQKERGRAKEKDRKEEKDRARIERNRRENDYRRQKQRDQDVEARRRRSEARRGEERREQGRRGEERRERERRDRRERMRLDDERREERERRRVRQMRAREGSTFHRSSRSQVSSSRQDGHRTSVDRSNRSHMSSSRQDDYRLSIERDRCRSPSPTSNWNGQDRDDESQATQVTLSTDALQRMCDKAASQAVAKVREEVETKTEAWLPKYPDSLIDKAKNLLYISFSDYVR